MATTGTNNRKPTDARDRLSTASTKSWGLARWWGRSSTPGLTTAGRAAWWLSLHRAFSSCSYSSGSSERRGVSSSSRSGK